MRSLLVTTILGVSEITDVIGQRFYQASSLGKGGIPAVPAKPFMLYMQMPETAYPQVRETGKSSSHVFNISAYDEIGSFVLIDSLLKATEQALKPLAGVVSPSGRRCIHVEWRGVSQDIVDPNYDANTRFGTVVMVG